MKKLRNVSLGAWCALFVFSFALPAAAGIQYRIESQDFNRLYSPVAKGTRILIRDVPVVNGERETLEVEPVEVWAPNAEVVLLGDGGAVIGRQRPMAARFFRGGIVGDPEAIVFIGMVGDRVHGVVLQDDRQFTIGRKRLREGAAESVFIEETSVNDIMASGKGSYHCDLDKSGVAPGRFTPSAVRSKLRESNDAALSTGTSTWVLNVAVETDYELYQNSGNVPGNVETFIANLVGMASTIYKRDLTTELRVSSLTIATVIGDPFTVVPGSAGTWNGSPVTYSTFHALLELGDRWQAGAPSANPRSSVALISGKTQLSGIAWVGTICTPNFPCAAGNCGSADADGHTGGGYSYNGGIDPPADLSVPNPDANSPTYTLPVSNYWPLLEFSHEFGHNVQSVHTHCIVLSGPDQATYGRAFVDTCFNLEGGCFGGAQVAPVEKGTIMSYCHLLGPTNSRYLFGKAGEASYVVPAAMKAAIQGATPGMSAITAPASLGAGASGAASVTNGGFAYLWSITNGTINSGGSTSAINFTATTNPVTLRVVATNTAGCSVADVKTVTVTAPGNPVKNDSDGNGKADIFWRHNSGLNAIWFMNGASLSSSAFTTSLDLTWTLGGLGDFDGNGKTDAIWRHSSGLTAVWLMDGTNISSSAFVPSLDGTWTLAGIGDFDGGGKDDILWRHSSGLNAIWFMNGAAVGSSGFTTSLDSSWSLKAVGDFNGNGREDLVWKHGPSGLTAAWLMNGLAIDSSGFLPTLDATWTLISTGDYNGNGRTDIFWRHNSGLNAMWFMNGAAVETGAFTTSLPTTWVPVASADYSGDGKADIVWRYSGGLMAVWVMDSTTISSSGFIPFLDNTWTARPNAATNAQ